MEKTNTELWLEYQMALSTYRGCYEAGAVASELVQATGRHTVKAYAEMSRAFQLWARQAMVPTNADQPA